MNKRFILFAELVLVAGALFSAHSTEAVKKATVVNRDLPRIIFNDDGLYIFQEREIWDVKVLRPTAENWPWIWNPVPDWSSPASESRCRPLAKFQTAQDFLNVRISHLKNTGVDCISFFDNWIDYQPHPVLGESVLPHLVEWGKNHGKYIFLSVRMNDQHHYVHNASVFDMTKRKFFMENRDLLIDPPTENEWIEIYQPWTTGQIHLPEIYRFANYGKIVDGALSKAKDLRFDWRHQKVRDHFLREILFKCERYRLDGVELDFWRTHKMFRTGQEEPDKITQFIRTLRKGLDEIGAKIGKKAFLVIRIPAPSETPTPSLEPIKWLTEKLLDGLIIGQGNYLHESILSPLLEIAHENHIKVYGPFERMPNSAYYENYGTPAMVRASAAVNRFKGVDGLYFFNYYIAEEMPVLSTLENLQMYDTEYCNEVATVIRDGLKAEKKVVTGFAVAPGEKGAVLVFNPLIIYDPPGTGTCRITLATKSIPAQLLALKINGVAVDDVGEAKYYNNSERLDHVISSALVTRHLHQGKNVIEVTIRDNPYQHPLVFKHLSVARYACPSVSVPGGE